MSLPLVSEAKFNLQIERNCNRLYLEHLFVYNDLCQTMSESKNTPYVLCSADSNSGTVENSASDTVRFKGRHFASVSVRVTLL